ncbi:hypothetical protein AVEN_82561-1, partial [Araneus ventricosus]
MRLPSLPHSLPPPQIVPPSSIPRDRPNLIPRTGYLSHWSIHRRRSYCCHGIKLILEIKRFKMLIDLSSCLAPKEGEGE